MYKSWGLDVAEFDPEAAAQGDLPDVVIVAGCAPNYYKGLVDTMFRAAAEGVHVVTLNPTDQWSAAIAKRLGFTYGGVLTIGPAEKGGALIPNCPKLFEGFPAKALLNAEFGAIDKWLHGMYLTYDTCLMCVADAGKGRIASAIAQYPVGRGAVTLVGPDLVRNPNDPACKRLLLNLIDLLPPAPKALKLPFIYHPVPPEGKPYFELRVPGSRNEYITAARPPDHLWHPALFFAWKQVNGRSFWEPRRDGAANRVVSHSETPTADGAIFESELAYEVKGRAILRERRTVKATVKPDGGYSLDWTGRFEALDDLAFRRPAPPTAAATPGFRCASRATPTSSTPARTRSATRTRGVWATFRRASTSTRSRSARARRRASRSSPTVPCTTTRSSSRSATTTRASISYASPRRSTATSR